MKYYIGIDIGTSSVKLTCIDENAKVAGESSREYKIEEPKVWMEGNRSGKMDQRDGRSVCGIV